MVPVVLFPSQRTRRFPQRLQLHNFIQLSRFLCHLVLDDHNLRGFVVTPIRSRQVLRDQKDDYPNSSHGLRCSACRPHTWKETALTEVWGANVVMLIYLRRPPPLDFRYSSGAVGRTRHDFEALCSYRGPGPEANGRRGRPLLRISGATPQDVSCRMAIRNSDQNQLLGTLFFMAPMLSHARRRRVENLVSPKHLTLHKP